MERRVGNRPKVQVFLQETDADKVQDVLQGSSLLVTMRHSEAQGKEILHLITAYAESEGEGMG